MLKHKLGLSNQRGVSPNQVQILAQLLPSWGTNDKNLSVSKSHQKGNGIESNFPCRAIIRVLWPQGGAHSWLINGHDDN